MQAIVFFVKFADILDNIWSDFKQLDERLLLKCVPVGIMAVLKCDGGK